MDSFNFELTKPVLYNGGGGQEVEGNHIELREPTGKVSHLCCGIRAMIKTAATKAMSSLSSDVKEAIKAQLELAADKSEAEKKAAEDEADEPMSADQILEMVYSGDADMDKFVSSFRELFRQVGHIGGDKPLSVPMMDKMSYKDFERMMGEYAANFIKA